MPVTVGVPKHLYSALGEDATNEFMEHLKTMELAYRAELQALNELNLARIEASFARIDAKFALIDTKFAQIDTKFAQVEAKFHQEIRSLQVSLLRWMFGFWATSTLTLAGLIVALLR